MIEISARHVHLSCEDLKTLFGEGTVLTTERICPAGAVCQYGTGGWSGQKETLKGVTVIGPVRSATQIELSMTDARSLGIDAPVRESGDIKGSAGCRLVGPKGEVELKEGLSSPAPCP